MREAGATQTLQSVQVLRAIAALFVVVGHASGAVGRLGQELGTAFPGLLFPGGAGVDLFFVISGFIMLYASESLFGRRGASIEFMRRRIFRIVPLYWLCTAAFVLTLAFGSRGIGSVDPASLAASLLFVPVDTLGHPQGMAFPLFDLGWTLNYEMMFYVVFAACIVLSREKAGIVAIAVILGIVLLGLVFSPGAIAFRFWTAPIIAEFAFGIAIALAKRRGVVLHRAVRLALVGLAIAILAADPGGLVGGASSLPTTPNDLVRVLCWGVPASLVLSAATLGPDVPNHAAGRALGRLGDASYSLYLTHPFVLIAALKLTPPASRIVGFNPWLVLVACVLGAVAVALASYALFERPSYAWLRARTTPVPTSSDDRARGVPDLPSERRTS